MTTSVQNLFQLNASSPFPSLLWASVYDHYGMLSAWYSASGQRLADYYYQALSAGQSADSRLRFWARITKQERANFVHVPAANDIANMSASLLFSEAPQIGVIGAGGKTEQAVPGSEAANDRLAEILAENNAGRQFSEGAEVAAALGGVFLKINTNQALAKVPLISLGHADAAFPEFTHGRLAKVTFWDVEEEDENGIIRVMETYGPGYVTTERYQATSSTAWGSKISGSTVQTGIEEIACVYVPNLRPHPQFRNAAGKWLGRADFFHLDSLMDSLDEIYTDWLRDIQLGKGRIIADQSMFKRDADTGTRYFDVDAQAYMGLQHVIGNELASLKDQLVVQQFDIRAEEHEKSYVSTLRTIYQMAGYAPTSFGLDVSMQPESGRALMTRDRRSFVTRNNKAAYWEPALEEFCELLLKVDRAAGFSSVTPLPVGVTLSDSITPDPMDVAQAVNLFSVASAASTDTLVRMANPGRAHDDAWVSAEVARIQAEKGLTLPPEPPV